MGAETISQEAFPVLMTVSLTIDVPTAADVTTLEPAILAAGRQAMRQAFHTAALSAQALVTTCPRCSSPTLHADGTSQRVILSSFGRVLIPVLRKRCPSCGLRFRASRAFCAPLGPDNITPTLAQTAAEAGAAWPFAAAASWLDEQLGAQISPESVRKCTVDLGTKAALRQQTEADHVVAPTASDVRTERDAALAAPLGLAPAPPAQLLVELDGGWVPSRDQVGGMEGKVSVVATGFEVLRKERQQLSPRRYAATFGSAERLGALTYAAAEELRGTEAEKQVVLGDGARWIKTQAAWHFPEAVTILDWSHLERAVHKAIRAARPGLGQKATRAALYEAIDGRLWEGKVEEALATLRRLRPVAGQDKIGALDDALEYVEGQRGWIGNYEEWEAQGYPIGSGAVEREVGVVINRRMKKQGMRWKRSNADAVVALRVERLNQEWDEAAEHRKLAA
jgi:hypothetical protein